jgi:hypothetical protein
MPVDPTALFNSILEGLAKVPPGLFAAVLLGGPTAIWLIVRFGHPPDGRKQQATATEEYLWVCVWCRSINEDTRGTCYSCHRSRLEQGEPGAADPGSTPLTAPRTWIAPGVGVAVGPGRPAEAQASGSWLGAQRVGAARPDDEASDLGGEPAELAEVDSPVAVASNVVEPVILEAKVKVSGRRPASRGR